MQATPLHVRTSVDIRLVLCMIVRNEGRVIGRCLESVLPHVDGYVICDTGSTDDTLSVVEQSALRFGVPGRVVRHPWQDFGHNRTLSAREARAWAEESGWSLDRTYLLLLDADMVLRVHPSFDKQTLSEGAYEVFQDNGSLRYANTRLARLSHRWMAVGATHEYWQAQEEGVTSSRLDTLHIEDIGDGGSKARKFERDIALLRNELARDPDNPRHTFYLAQSFFDTGRWSQAAQWYARRWELGGWDEERWLARYRHGLCLLRLGEGQRAVGLLLEAFDHRPSRAEPLWAVARHYREISRNRVALMFALKGLEIPYPVEDVLFVERPVYEWQLWEEVMISAFYAGEDRHGLGLHACERLLAQRGHGDDFYAYVLGNEAFYLPPLPALRRGSLPVPPSIRTFDGVEFSATNPTVTRWRSAVHVGIRLLNYRHESGLNYTSMSPDGVFRTYNANQRWNPQIHRGSAFRVSQDVPNHWPADTWGRGLEDVRWTVFQDRVWFTAVCYQVPGAEGACRMVLGRLDEDLSAVDHLVPLRYEKSLSVEKNWLLWPDADGTGLRVIYAYDPLVVLRVDPATGDTSTLRSIEPPFRAASFRGSCAPVPIPGRTGRWLGMVHEVAVRPSGRVYSHRWIELDDEEGLRAYSRPFVFDHVGIEYAAGLCDLDGHRLLVTYGFEDREARWVEVGWEHALESLRTHESDPADPVRP